MKKQKMYLAGGCFWGVEYYLQNIEGIIETQVGFMGGKLNNPTYEQICTEDTNHVEVVEVIFDGEKVGVEEIIKVFFEIHDPTQVDGQGPDIGKQYRSEIFYTNDDQKEIAEKLIKVLEGKGLKIVTQVTKAKEFWKAEDSHQKYYEKNGKEPYCHIRVKRF